MTAFDDSGESGPSNQASAQTTGGTGSVSVAAAGDIACHPNELGYNNGNGNGSVCMQKATSDLVVAGSYDKVLALGDLQYDCGSLAAFNASYDPTWGRFASKTEPVIGNHELQGMSERGRVVPPEGLRLLHVLPEPRRP